MKPHKIEFDELMKWYQTEEVTFASSTRERKKLVATLFGNFKVIVAGTTIWEGVQANMAVDKYNSVTEKYIDPLKDFKI